MSEEIDIMRAAFHARAPDLYRGEHLPTWLDRFPDDPNIYGDDAGTYKHTCAQNDFEMFCEGWRAASNWHGLQIAVERAG